MTNENNAYDGYTPSKESSTRGQQSTQAGLPGGEHAQWENLTRTHAQIDREYYSLRSIVKRHVNFDHFDCRAAVGIIFLLIVLAAFLIAT
jgi:hypothetical protein